MAIETWGMKQGHKNSYFRPLPGDFLYAQSCEHAFLLICYEVTCFHLKVLENPGENWELLVEGFLEYRRRDPVASGIAALHTPKGQETMTEILREMVQTINGPIVIAWDTQEQKVSRKMLLKRNQPHH